MTVDLARMLRLDAKDKLSWDEDFSFVLSGKYELSLFGDNDLCSVLKNVADGRQSINVIRHDGILIDTLSSQYAEGKRLRRAH